MLYLELYNTILVKIFIFFIKGTVEAMSNVYCLTNFFSFISNNLTILTKTLELIKHQMVVTGLKFFF